MLEEQRTLPESLAAEQAAVGAMLLERAAVEEAMMTVRAEDFFYEKHQVICRAIYQLYDENRPVDIIALGERLRDQGQLDFVGGTLSITTVMTQVPTAANVTHYAQAVRDCAVLRRLIRVGSELMELGYNSPTLGPLDRVLERAEAKVMAVTDRYQQNRVDETPSAYEIVRAAIDARHQADADGKGMGLPCGLTSLDKLMEPVKPGEVVYIAGRPSMGKSGLAMQFALQMSANGAKGAYFSLEMSADSLASRILAAYSGVPRSKMEQIHYRKYSDDVYPALEEAAEQVRPYPLRVIDQPRLTAFNVQHILRRLKHVDGRVDFAVIDYLQLMEPNDERLLDSYQRMTAICKEVRRVAREMGVALFLVSQLSRKVEDRSPCKPMMSDLRDSGQAEQDADKIILIYRPDYYGEKERNKQGISDPSATELHLAKQRNGPTGSAWVHFDAARVWFVEDGGVGGN